MKLETPTILSPFWYALGAFFACPIVALLTIAVGVVILLVWPVLPFFMYVSRQNKILQAQARLDTRLLAFGDDSVSASVFKAGFEAGKTFYDVEGTW